MVVTCTPSSDTDPTIPNPKRTHTSICTFQSAGLYQNNSFPTSVRSKIVNVKWFIIFFFNNLNVELVEAMCLAVLSRLSQAWYSLNYVTYCIQHLYIEHICYLPKNDALRGVGLTAKILQGSELLNMQHKRAHKQISNRQGWLEQIPSHHKLSLVRCVQCVPWPIVMVTEIDDSRPQSC